MGAVDFAVGEAFGFATKDCNPPKVRAGEAMLLYMPHCDRSLYEAVLATNLPPNVSGRGDTAEDTVGAGLELAQVVLIGNSFEAYDFKSLQHHGSAPAAGNWQLMQMVLPYLNEELLPAYSS